MEEVGSHDSFSLSLSLCREGLVCGPSSGFNLKGLYQFIDKRKADGSLAELAGEDGEIHCVFLCCDLPYQYINEYFDKLGAEHFPTIHNEHLTKVDLHRYDDSWEKEPAEALGLFFTQDDQILASAVHMVPITSKVKPQPQTSIIDFRQPLDFHDFHLPGSVNVPFVHEDTPSPFSEPYILESLWKRLEETFKAPNEELRDLLRGRRILLLCYDGDSARVATSVLRAKGYEADSVKGGFKALRRLREESDSTCSFRARNDSGVEVNHLPSVVPVAAQVV